MTSFYWPDSDATFNPRQEPLPVPAAGVHDGDVLLIRVNPAWWSHALGALDILTRREAWDGTEAEIDHAVQQVEKLMQGINSGASAQYTANESADYITTATSFVDVSPNMALPVTTAGGDILLGFSGNLKVYGSGAATVYFDITQDGQRIAGDDGLFFVFVHSNLTVADQYQPAAFTKLLRDVPAGPHEYRLQWKVFGGAGAIMYAGAGTLNIDPHPQFWLREIF